jgi:RNA polymerase sigma-70 factor (ECF subfamily)
MPTLIRQTAEIIAMFEPKDRLPGRLSREHYDVLSSDAAGMSYADIAQLIGCPVGTIKSRLNRARIKLDVLVKTQPATTPPTETNANA